MEVGSIGGRVAGTARAEPITMRPMSRPGRLRRALAWLVGLGRSLGWARAVVAAAFATVAVMYGCNEDMGGQPHAKRGDGVYRPVLARGDGHLMFLMARSIAFDGDLEFTNDLRRFGDPFGQLHEGRPRPAIPHPIGPPLVWVPLLWAAQGGAVVADSLGADIPLHGYTEWHQRLAFSTSALAAMIAVALGLALARRLGGGRWGPSYAAAAILLGTSLTYYATYMPSYSHALDAGAAAGFLYAWATTLGRWDRRRIVVLGVTLGVAALMRVQELALGLVVALEVAVAARRPPADAAPWRYRLGLLARGAAVAAIAVVVLAPQAVVWKVVYGSFTSLPQGASYTRPGYPMILELLFSSRNGWFATHPLAYAGALGLIVLAVRGPRVHAQARLVALGLLLTVAVQVYLNSIIIDWWGQASFGQRRLCSMTLPLVVGLAAWLELGVALLRGRPGARAIGHGLAVVGLGWFVWWNLASVWPLDAGRPAQFGPGPCCPRVKGVLRDVGTAVYRRVGNPFAFPANAIFAARHDVGVDRWDKVVGDYPWVPALGYTPEMLRRETVGWRVGSPRKDPYVLHGFGRGQSSHGGVRWTTARRAVALVPNLIPEPLVVTLWLKPNLPPGVATRRVIVRWNGRVVAERALTGEAEVSWTIEGDVGLNQLELEAPVEPASDEARAWGAVGAVGVAVGDLRFTGA